MISKKSQMFLNNLGPDLWIIHDRMEAFIKNTEIRMRSSVFWRNLECHHTSIATCYSHINEELVQLPPIIPSKKELIRLLKKVSKSPESVGFNELKILDDYFINKIFGIAELNRSCDRIEVTEKAFNLCVLNLSRDSYECIKSMAIGLLHALEADTVSSENPRTFLACYKNIPSWIQRFDDSARDRLLTTRILQFYSQQHPMFTQERNCGKATEEFLYQSCLLFDENRYENICTEKAIKQFSKLNKTKEYNAPRLFGN